MDDSTTEERLLRRAHTRALRALSVRPRSERELDALLARRFPPDVVRATRVRLREEGLVDDDQFAKLWATSRAQSRGFGAARIRRELAAKGVASESVEVAISAAVADETEAALAAARTRRRQYARLPADAIARRLSAWLRRRGYSTRTIITVLRAEGIFAGPEPDDREPPPADTGE